MVAYAVLALLVRRAFGPGLRRAGAATIAAALIAVAYGAVDEIHQGFVPGRVPAVADAVADAVGAMIGAWLAGHGIALRRNGRTRRSS